MKKMVFTSLVLLSGCITMSGGPFVDVKSGLPYATLSGDEQSSDIKLWIGSVDGKFSRKEPILSSPWLQTKNIKFHVLRA